MAIRAWATLGCGDNQIGTAHFPGCDGISGHICTVAGTGIAGDGADDLAPLSTRLYLPQDMTVAPQPDGRLYVVDWNNHRIRVIDHPPGAAGQATNSGVMRIVAGAGELGLAVDDPASNRLNHPTNVAFNGGEGAAAGQLVIAAWHNSRVKTVDLETGETVDVCGNGKRGFAGNGGPAATATLDLPVAVVFEADGNMLIADQANQMIRRVDQATGFIETIAGTGHCADAVNPAPCVLNDGGPATGAGFHFPIGQAASPGGRIALDAEGNIYVADTENFRLRRIDRASGLIDTYAGNGTWGFAGDGGPAREAQLGRLADVAVGPDGAVYLADTDNDCVRVVAPSGTISTFAGICGKRGFSGQNGPATEARLNRPYGVEVSPSGDVYIADTHNNRVRVVFH
jgi:sugar lactone lactonase YvrE